MILKIIDCDSGKITFEGVDVTRLRGKELREFRRSVQIVFQDTQASLDPRMTAQRSAEEPLRVQGQLSQSEMRQKISELFATVGLNESIMHRYPHELSGGQRQRVVIARALALQPKILVLDEPTSSLDVSVQAQILNLLKQIQQRLGLTYIFISHNLSVVGFMATRVAVMYLGQIVELSSVSELMDDPKHPYSKALLAASPVADPDVKREDVALSGDLPSPLNPPAACRFHTRCPYVMEICRETPPGFVELSRDRLIRCYLYLNQPSPPFGSAREGEIHL